MANTYTLIASNTLSSPAASVTFSSIPSTYTDLVLRLSLRGDNALVYNASRMRFNGDTASNYSRTYIEGNGAAASSARAANTIFFSYIMQNGANATANTFGNGEVYIPNYTSSINKPFFVNSVNETNATTAYITPTAGLWRNTSVIDTILVYPPSGNFVSGSSFFLYGIKNS